MRAGIFNLLEKKFAVDLSKVMPYHETLTVFWMRTIRSFISERTNRSLPDQADELVSRYDKDYPLRFYTKEFLFSDGARAAFLDGDLDDVPV